jgi:hypothetical protein
MCKCYERNILSKGQPLVSVIDNKTLRDWAVAHQRFRTLPSHESHFEVNVIAWSNPDLGSPFSDTMIQPRTIRVWKARCYPSDRNEQISGGGLLCLHILPERTATSRNDLAWVRTDDSRIGQDLQARCGEERAFTPRRLTERKQSVALRGESLGQC